MTTISCPRDSATSRAVIAAATAAVVMPGRRTSNDAVRQASGQGCAETGTLFSMDHLTRRRRSLSPAQHRRRVYQFIRYRLVTVSELAEGFAEAESHGVGNGPPVNELCDIWPAILNTSSPADAQLP